MPETTGQWRDSGSGAGHVQQVIVTEQMRIDEAWRRYTGHTVRCEACRSGVDCDEALALRAAWRALSAPETPRPVSPPRPAGA